MKYNRSKNDPFWRASYTSLSGHSTYTLLQPIIGLIIVWYIVKVSVRQLCSLKLTYNANLYAFVANIFIWRSCNPPGWRLQPMCRFRTLVSPPLMSSRHCISWSRIYSIGGTRQYIYAICSLHWQCLANFPQCVDSALALLTLFPRCIQ